MKIGILTYHAAYNFGANLQALSTFSYLKNAGHEPIIIDFMPEGLEIAFDKTVPKIQADAHKKFLSEHFVLTGRCRDSKGVAKEIERNGIQAVIIGSDAVVQHYPRLARLQINPSRKSLISARFLPIKYETNFPNPFWGEFIHYLNHKIKVAMMSVSCQNSDYSVFTGKEKKAIFNMVKNIEFISVRDQRTADLFSRVSAGNIIPKVTPDPVFAFNINYPNSIPIETLKQKFGLADKYMLLSFNSISFVSKEWTSEFRKIANQAGYQCVALAMPGGVKFEHDLDTTIDIPIDPIEWYSLIKNASAYIGEKMHPLIISLHNAVPFYCFDHYGILRFKIFQNQKASKIYHILKRANLTDFRVSILRKINFTPPSPNLVFHKILTFDKTRCMSFSNKMKSEYKEMMVKILYNLSNN